MLDGLLGRGFSSKCKSLIKLTRTRLDAIKRKRNAMQKYLKKDISELLANGLDINAYGRAEGLSIELNLSSCYDFVEQFCESIPKHLSLMQKQRECPEEGREAVSSLMFAAARFADLPELRDLRDIFTERYEKTLESFVNQEFVENLASKPPTTENKLQLMRDIAQEFSIKWDSKAFEQKIANSPLPAKDQPKRLGSMKDPKIDEHKLHRLRSEGDHQNIVKEDNQDVLSRRKSDLTDDRYRAREQTTYRLRSEGDHQTIIKEDIQDVSSRRKSDLTDDRYKQHKGREETILERDKDYTDNSFKPRNGRDHTTWKREICDVVSRQEYSDDGFKPHKGRDDTIQKRDNLDNSFHGRIKYKNGHELHNGREETVRQRDKQESSSCREQDYPTMKQKTKMESPFAGDNHKAPSSNLTEKAIKGAESIKPLPPPPYLKPIGGKNSTRYANSDPVNKASADVLANDISERVQTVFDRADHDERKVARLARVNGDDNVDHQDDLVGDKKPKPKPKSVRRRHFKPPPGQDYRGNNEGDEAVKRYPNERRREDTRQGLQHALDDGRGSKDDEERMMDKLLMHYSKKTSKFEAIKVSQGLNTPLGHHDAGEPQRHRRKDVARLDPEPIPPPSRAISLPPDPVTPTESGRVPARAASFQPEMLNPGGHVHPRLPDYDDLAATFAALRGR